MVETMSPIKEKYHELLAADPIEAGRSLSFLYDGISDKIVYKGKPIPIILEPGFISSEQLQSNTSMLGEIQNALEHVIDIAVERYVPKSEERQFCEDIKQVFNLNKKELALMTTDCGVFSMWLFTDSIYTAMDNHIFWNLIAIAPEALWRPIAPRRCF